MVIIKESEHAILQETMGARWTFREILNSRVRYFRDSDGWPLGEQEVPDLCQKIGTELVRCAYPGSRHHHAKPMNAFFTCLAIQAIEIDP